MYVQDKQTPAARLRGLADSLRMNADIPTEVQDAAAAVDVIAQQLEQQQQGMVSIPVEVAREWIESHRMGPAHDVKEARAHIDRAVASTEALDAALSAALTAAKEG